MKTSESIKHLSAALHAAQAEIGGVIADSNNPFFKSKYADLGSVIRTIKEPLHKHGLAYTQLPISNEDGVGVRTMLLHTSGEFIEDSFTLPLAKRDPQAAGAAITYARRYALAALGGCPTVDDDAESAMFRNEPAKPLFTDEEKEIYDDLLEGDPLAFFCWLKTLHEEIVTALYNSGEKGKKMALKKKHDEAERAGFEALQNVVDGIKQMIAEDDIQAFGDLAELSECEKKAVWVHLDEAEQDWLKNAKARAA